MSRLVSNRKRRSKTGLIIFCAIIAIVAVGVGVAIWLFPKNQPASSEDQNSGVNYNPPTEEEQQTGENISEPSKTGDTKPTSSENLEAFVPYANFANGTLKITTEIGQIITGSCTLKIWDGKPTSETPTEILQVYEETVAITALPSSSTCEGFTVTDRLSPNTEYTIIIFIRADDGRVQELEVNPQNQDA